MKLFRVVCTLVFAGCVIVSTIAKEEAADVVYRNGNIYTVDEKSPHAQAIAVRAGKILFVGSNEDAQKLAGPDTKVVDLAGLTVVPGLTDAHCHLSGVGARELEFNLEGTNSLQDFLNKIKERVAKAKPGEWITGRGWIETYWKPQSFPTRWDIDTVSPNNPVWLVRADGHGAVANSLAINLAKIDKRTPSPFGGEIMRDKATGEANGMFLDNAQSLITRLIPATSAAEHEKEILVGVERSLSLGWTTLHIPGNSYAEVAIIKRLYSQGKIKIRLYDAIRGPGEDSRRLLSDGPQVGLFGNRFTIRDIKVTMDGALGSKGAWLLENYSDYDTAGFPKYKEADVLPMFEEALRKGIQVETHAIGDRANREVLNYYEKAFKVVPPEQRKNRDPRWRIEHAQILSPADIPRFKQLGVIPSMQPSHAIGDLHFAASRLGRQRLAGAYAWESLRKTGVMIAGGSDAPVERGEPMIEYYAAVARKNLTGFSGEDWHLEEKLSRDDALKMFTIWPAYAAFEENEKGSLGTGKLADFTVLSQDIMRIAEPEILKTKCVLTVVGGEIVYDGRQ